MSRASAMLSTSRSPSLDCRVILFPHFLALGRRHHVQQAGLIPELESFAALISKGLGDCAGFGFCCVRLATFQQAGIVVREFKA